MLTVREFQQLLIHLVMDYHQGLLCHYLCAVFAQDPGYQKRALASWLQQYLDTRVMETKRLPKSELILGIGV